MDNQYLQLADSLMKSQSGKNILKNLGKLKQLTETPEGKRFMTRLLTDKSGALKNVVDAVAANDRQKARQILSELVSGPEGENITAKIFEIME